MPDVKTLLFGCGVVGVAVCTLLVHSWIALVASLVTLYVAYLLPNPHTTVSATGKAVVITGCDSGFGWHLAKKLDSLGFQVFAGCLFPEGEGASELIKLCSSNLHTVKLDVTSDEQVANAVTYVRNNLINNGLWAVVNNAGVTCISEIEWCPVIEYERMLAVNLIGTVRVTKAFLPDVRAVRGRVINVASLSGRYTTTSFAAYCASKAAVISFSDGLRREMRKFAVSVSLIEPPLYETPISDIENLLRVTDSHWRGASEEVREAYGENYYRAFKNKVLRVLTSIMRKDIDEVIDAMTHAVMAVNPKARYLPTLPPLIRTAIVISLPYYMVDGRITRFLTPDEPVNLGVKDH